MRQAGATSQMSLTFTAIVTGTILCSGGQRRLTLGVAESMRGGIVSITVTLVDAEPTLPETSTARNTTGVVPSGNTAGASLVSRGAASQMSLTPGDGSVTGVPAHAVCSTVVGAGTFESVGDVVSWTMT